jgi:hypothetical protein
MDYKSSEPTEDSGYSWQRDGMSIDYAMPEPTRESTIHHQVTEPGETAQRLLKLTKMLAEKLKRVMGPDHGTSGRFAKRGDRSARRWPSGCQSTSLCPVTASRTSSR